MQPTAATEDLSISRVLMHRVGAAILASWRPTACWRGDPPPSPPPPLPPSQPRAECFLWRPVAVLATRENAPHGRSAFYVTCICLSACFGWCLLSSRCLFFQENTASLTIVACCCGRAPLRRPDRGPVRMRGPRWRSILDVDADLYCRHNLLPRKYRSHMNPGLRSSERSVMAMGGWKRWGSGCRKSPCY